MFPLRDDNPTLHASLVTFAIIALNALAWVLLQGMGTDPALGSSVCELGAIPGHLLGRVPAGTQVPLGPGAFCVLGDTPDWRTPVTSMFLHGGWFHIIGNLWFLYVFGDNVEDAMGPLRFAVFYLICGLAAFAAQAISEPSSAVPMVGASGAIGGVMGAYAVLYPRAPVHMIVFIVFYVDRIVVPAVYMLGYWFVLQLIGGAGGEGGVAFWAHVGGFVAGLVLVRPFCTRSRLAPHRTLLSQRARGW